MFPYILPNMKNCSFEPNATKDEFRIGGCNIDRKERLMAQATVSARIDSKDKANDIEALKKGIEQLNAGKGIVKTLEELEAMENG